MTCSDIFLGLIAILFPPIAVWIKSGICSADSFINILLCMLGYIPGLIHAWYIISKYPEHDYDRVDDSERQERVTYYYVTHDSTSGRSGRREQRQQRVQGYGTVPKPSTVAHSQPQYQAPQPPQPQQQSGVVRAGNTTRPSGSAGPSAGAAGDDQGAPPPYSDVVRGDHKVQTRD